MRKLMLVLGFLAVSGFAYADPVSVALLAFNGGNWQWGYPYYGYVQGAGSVDLMCDDYVHGGVPGITWSTNPTDLGSGNLSTLRFNNLPGASTLYDEAGWLLLQTQTTPHDAWRDMNVAVWHIFDQASPMTPFAEWWLGQAQEEAANGFQGVDFNRVEVLTPIDQYSSDPNAPQELMYLTADNQPSTVPEPGTWLFLGTGIAAMLARKRIAYQGRLSQARRTEDGRNC